ncbi:Uncharacterised protein [Mycobacterium tuberculosis]|nr:Uncharacterised protein [Mycobacterium tuberculosis]
MVQTILIVGATGAAYPVLLFLTRVMTVQDLQHLPGPLRKLSAPILARLGRDRQSDLR